MKDRVACWYISSADLSIDGHRGQFAYTEEDAHEKQQQMRSMSKYPKHVTIWPAWKSEGGGRVSWEPRYPPERY
jgi:hypothetical protein